MSKYNVKPDYSHCITGIPNSILKYFNIEPNGKTNRELDAVLNREYKNVVLLVLDGVGNSVISRNLGFESSFYQHKIDYVSSVFPSSTVPATTSLLSGLLPCEHAWAGWDVYYKEIGQNVTVFTNNIQNTDKQAAEYHVARTLTPYRTILDRITEAGYASYMVSPYQGIISSSMADTVKKIKKLTDEDGTKFIYAYWPESDDILHMYGGGGEEKPQIKKFLIDTQQKIVKLTKEMQDTVLIITADHGHTDVQMTYPEEHADLMDTLERLPSLEPRAAAFFVKKGRKREFKKLFSQYYGDQFDLMTSDEAIERGIFGTNKPHPKFRSMLGDYIAIARDDMSFNFVNGEKWVSCHGGLSEQEMYVPLIVYKDHFFLGTDVESYIGEALNRLKKKYPWADRSMFDKKYRYEIEEGKCGPEFVRYFRWDKKNTDRYAEGWDGEKFIDRIILDQEDQIQYANEVVEELDVRPDYGVDAHGWHLEIFKFRKHRLGGYSAYVQAGDRTTGGSREFFFTPDQMAGSFEDFLQSNGELLSGAFGLTADYMRKFKGLKEFLGFEN